MALIRYIISQIMRRPHIYFSVVCLITVLCGYLLTYLASTTLGSQVIWAFFYISAIIWGYLRIKHYVKVLRIRLRAKKSGTFIDIKAPEFKKLAEEMKIELDKNHPFILQEKLDNAYYNPQNKRVVFGEILFNRLAPPERLAILSHEFAHPKRHHFLKVYILLFVSLLLTIVTLQREPDLIFFITWWALTLAICPHLSRKFEYEADAEAVSRTNIKTTISSLRKSEKKERWDQETITHPSVNRRIEKLHRH